MTTTTADHVLDGIDLHDTHFVVTGGSSGLGFESAAALARAGAAVTITGRDAGRLAEASELLRGNGPIDTLEMDLTDLHSVIAAATALDERLHRLDALVLNAGVMACPLTRTANGFELQLAANHLGHHLLTAQLTDLLRRSAPSRVISLSSSGHVLGGVDFDDPNFEQRPYEPWQAYAQAKTATSLHAVEVAARLGDDGVQAFAVHPGVAHTNLQRHLSDDQVATVFSMSEAMGDQPRSAAEAASTIVWAATSKELGEHNGNYLADRALADAQRAVHASNPELAARLWQLSTTLLGSSMS